MPDTPNSSSLGLMCPVCRVDLVMTERQGIEIDYCSKCRGVWLDRGELDKVIERSLPQAASFDATNVPPGPRAFSPGRIDEYGRREPHYDRGGHGDHGGREGHGGRRGSFLSRLFDD